MQYSPEGHPFLNGPYCGVFYAKDTKKPFLGLAFKANSLLSFVVFSLRLTLSTGQGTNPTDWREVFVDLKFAMQMAVGKILWGSPVHRGFYQTMFLKFPKINTVPLGMSLFHLYALTSNAYHSFRLYQGHGRQIPADLPRRSRH